MIIYNVRKVSCVYCCLLGHENWFHAIRPSIKTRLSGLIVLQCLKSLMDEHLKLRVIVFGFAD